MTHRFILDGISFGIYYWEEGSGLPEKNYRGLPVPPYPLLSKTPGLFGWSPPVMPLCIKVFCRFWYAPAPFNIQRDFKKKIISVNGIDFMIISKLIDYHLNIRSSFLSFFLSTMLGDCSQNERGDLVFFFWKKKNLFPPGVTAPEETGRKWETVSFFPWKELFLEWRKAEKLFPVKVMWKVSLARLPFSLWIFHFRKSKFSLNSFKKEENIGDRVLSFSIISGRIDPHDAFRHHVRMKHPPPHPDPLPRWGEGKNGRRWGWFLNSSPFTFNYSPYFQNRHEDTSLFLGMVLFSQSILPKRRGIFIKKPFKFKTFSIYFGVKVEW